MSAISERSLATITASGEEIRDALVSSIANRTAILSARQGDTTAMRLYQRRGWQPLVTDYQFPSSPKPHTILGLDLSQRTNRYSDPCERTYTVLHCVYDRSLAMGEAA